MLRLTVSRPVCLGVKSTIWGLIPDFYYCLTVAGLLILGTLSDESTSLSFTIAAGPRQHSHSRVRVPRDSLTYFTLSEPRLPQPGGPGPVLYSPGTGDPIRPSGTGFPFRRLLRLAGLRWSYSNPPPRGNWLQLLTGPSYNTSARTA
jgi:hypothetical protein